MNDTQMTAANRAEMWKRRARLFSEALDEIADAAGAIWDDQPKLTA